MGFESDPLYPGYYQSGPLEKASVGCHNLTLEGATVAQPGPSAAFSRDQESQTQQMVDASILRNKVRNWYLEIETTLTLSKSSQTVVPWVWSISDFHPVKWGVIQNQRLYSSDFLRKASQIWQNLGDWFVVYKVIIKWTWRFCQIFVTFSEYTNILINWESMYVQTKFF